jgi:hypothetical protein
MIRAKGVRRPYSTPYCTVNTPARASESAAIPRNQFSFN